MIHIRAFRPMSDAIRSYGRSGLSMNLFKGLKQALVSSLAGDYDRDAVNKELDGYISSSKKNVVMLSFQNCPFCVRAREVLTEEGIKYDDIMVEQLPDNRGKHIRAEMGKRFGQTSVPAIWINQEFIGGCNNGGIGGLIPLKESGKLTELMKF
jgi:glutaredoxin 3